MDLSSISGVELIDLQFEASTKEEVLEKMSKRIFDTGVVTDHGKFLEGLKERELELTTGFGEGIAIPHCKSEAVKEAKVAISRLKKGVDWDALDGNPVTYVIMLAVPADEADTTHLKILTMIASNLANKEFIANLYKIDEPKEVLEYLSK